MNNLISVIVPVYKVEKYLNRCIDSILNQSYKNFELILVDDGSLDNCPKICDEYKDKDNRIIVIHKENGGQSSARNTGLEICQGDYITFVDSDDFIHEDYLKIMLNNIIEYNADIVQCDFEEGIKDYFENRNVKNEPVILDKYSALENYLYKVLIWGKLYKKEIINNIRFPYTNKYEDDATYYKFAYNSKKIILISNVLYYYFQSSNSVMRNNSNFIKEDFIDIYNERMNFFKEKKDIRLVEATHIRFTMVLMLFILDCKSNPNNENDTNKLYDKFCQEYNIIKKYKRKPRKLSILFFLFRYYPSCSSYFVNKLKLLKK